MKTHFRFSFILIYSFLYIILPFTQAQSHRALLIGINNYTIPGTKNVSKDISRRTRYKNLRGAVNDIDGIYSLLISKFNFSKKDIVVLRDNAASRERIIKEIDNHLIEKSGKGDFVLFYYSGHGSQVYNSKSNEFDKKDESIVPADSRLGSKDIRDKELAVLYDKILNKGVELNVIMDCCYSGSGARGLSRGGITRSLDPIEEDIADPTAIFPSAEDRGALIISAAQDYQQAEEIHENNSYDGLFSYSLIKILRESPKNISVNNLFLKVKGLMQSFAYSQEPVLAGGINRREKSLFGSLSDSKDNSIYVAVTDVDLQEGVKIQGGIALGLFDGSELVNNNSEKNKVIKLKVIKNIGITLSLCEVIQGDIKDVKEGDLFKVSRLSSNPNSTLKIWVPSPLDEEKIYSFYKIINKFSNNSNVKLIDDPTEIKPDYTLYYENNDWKLIDTNGRITKFDYNALNLSITKGSGGKSSISNIFICYPPTKKLIDNLKSKISENDLIIEFIDKKEYANYFLLGRIVKDSLEYCYAIPNYSNKNNSDFPLPIRSDWIKISDSNGVNNLLESAIKINRVKGWMQLSNSNGSSSFCYKLGIKKYNSNEIITEGSLFEGDIYKIFLIEDTTLEQTEARYFYVFEIDTWGNSKLLYPGTTQGNVENYIKRKTRSDEIKDNIIDIGSFKVIKPLGLENFYLLSTTEPLPDPSVLEYSGVRTRGKREAKNLLNAIISNIGYSTRGKYYNPESWSIDKYSFLSLEKHK